MRGEQRAELRQLFSGDPAVQAFTAEARGAAGRRELRGERRPGRLPGDIESRISNSENAVGNANRYFLHRRRSVNIFRGSF